MSDQINKFNGTSIATELSRRSILSAVATSAAFAAIPILSSSRVASAVQQISTSGDSIVPFKVNIPAESVEDLRNRLRYTRWPERETVNDWSQGVPLEKAKALVTAWRDKYDWKSFETRINKLPNFLTKIDGLDIHFFEIKSHHPKALPIVLTHGWPGSFVEFLEVIGPLTDPTAFGGRPEDAFDVVIPSLPGYGFSGKPSAPGWSAARTAKAWTTLMERLGYDRWVAQGGDWGAAVTTALGRQKPSGLAAIHLNWPFVFPETIPAVLSTDEKRAVDEANEFRNNGFAYFLEMATRPQTMGYGLADSPVGLATFIYEKFQAWSDNTGNPEEALSVETMLNDISLYWFTNSAASSGRFYWENASSGFSQGKLDLPVAVTVFPREIYQAPRSWTEQTYSNLIYYSEVTKGGHFAAMEQPKLFAEELRKAFASLRT